MPMRSQKIVRAALALTLSLALGGCPRWHPPLVAKVGDDITQFVMEECWDPGIYDLEAGLVEPGVVVVQGLLLNFVTRANLETCLREIEGVWDVWDATILINDDANGGASSR